MENVISQFAYNILQTLLADTTIYNFLKAYPKDQWNVLIRLLTFYSVKSILSKYRKPPDITRVQSLCTSSYDSNSPYLLKEKINDIHNKLLSIDKQILQLVDIDVKESLQIETQNLVKNSPLEISGVENQFEEINKNLRGIRSVSSSRLQKSGMKHSILIPQCKDVSDMSNTEMYNLMSKLDLPIMISNTTKRA